MSFSTAFKAKLLRQYGPWALVTGASSGIGLELSKRLAEAGFHLILTARRAALLEQIQQQLTTKHKVKVHIVAADASEPEGMAQILAAADEVDLGLVVASAGFGSSGLFLHSTLADEQNMVRLNCESLLGLVHYASQRLASHRLEKQQRGGIILMSSLVAFQGVPYSANYAATKAYVQSLSEALAVELKPLGVDVLAAAPGPVQSGFADRAHMQMSMYLTPSQVGIPILKALGRQSTVLPGLLSKVLVNSLRTLPRWGKIRIMKVIMQGMSSTMAS